PGPRRLFALGERAAVEVAEALPVSPEPRHRAAGRVHEVRDPLLQPGQHLVRLGLRNSFGRDGLVELLLRVGDERGDEAVGRFAVVLRDLRKALTVLELRSKLGFGHPDVSRSGIETAEEAEVVTALAVEPTDQREVT